MPAYLGLRMVITRLSEGGWMGARQIESACQGDMGLE